MRGEERDRKEAKDWERREEGERERIKEGW